MENFNDYITKNNKNITKIYILNKDIHDNFLRTISKLSNIHTKIDIIDKKNEIIVSAPISIHNKIKFIFSNFNIKKRIL